jgi:hypothetical protein
MKVITEINTLLSVIRDQSAEHEGKAELKLQSSDWSALVQNVCPALLLEYGKNHAFAVIKFYFSCQGVTVEQGRYQFNGKQSSGYSVTFQSESEPVKPLPLSSFVF